MKFTKIPVDTFKKLQLNAGMLLRNFNPATAEYVEEDIVGATTGGTTFSAVPSYSDFGADIDNCPKNTKELKKLEGWEVTASGAYVTVDTAGAVDLLGAAGIDESDPTKVVPRNDLLAEDFKDLWLVADYSDDNSEENGGYVAIHMMDALSTGGFQLKTADKAKGNLPFTYTAHASIENQSTPPFELYLKSGGTE